MPHLKITATRPLAELQAELAPFSERDELGVHKLLGSYLERDGEELLLELLVAEGTLLPRHFFASLKLREGQLLLRCLPLTDPEKTDGVRRALARLGRRILALCPAAELVSGTLLAELAALPADEDAG